jgi:glycosyltransferase involved in cell wall biosynthesis
VKDSILIVAPSRSASATRRATELADGLRTAGLHVRVTDAGDALGGVLTRHSCTITLSPGLAAHLVGHALRRRGSRWIADLELPGHEDGPLDRIERRLIMSADQLITVDEASREAIFHKLHLSAASVPGGADAINQQVGALLESPQAKRRILMLGPVNSPHLEHLAIALRDRGNAVRATGEVWGGGLQSSSLPDLGIPVTPIGVPKILSLRGLLRRYRPDVVHANWMPFAVLAALAGARPLVAMAWGSDVYLAGRHQLQQYRLVFRRADLILADSQALLDRLITLGAPAERTALFNWGVDLAHLKPSEDRAALKADLGLGEGPVIISARGLKALYNPDVVLDAFTRVKRLHPSAQLIFKHQGDGEDQLARLSLIDGVRVVGRIAYEQLLDYFRAADVCLSIPDTDSAPRSVWEAMACGCPCVLSDLPWVHEQIRSGEHALVTRIDPSEVADAIVRLLEDPGLRDAIVARARALVESHHDTAVQMDRLEDMYARLAR